MPHYLKGCYPISIQCIQYSTSHGKSGSLPPTQCEPPEERMWREDIRGLMFHTRYTDLIMVCKSNDLLWPCVPSHYRHKSSVCLEHFRNIRVNGKFRMFGTFWAPFSTSWWKESIESGLLDEASWLYCFQHLLSTGISSPKRERWQTHCRLVSYHPCLSQGSVFQCGTKRGIGNLLWVQNYGDMLILKRPWTFFIKDLSRKQIRPWSSLDLQSHD